MTREEWQWRSAMLRRRGRLGSGSFHRVPCAPRHEEPTRQIPPFVSPLWAWLRGKRKDRPR